MAHRTFYWDTLAIREMTKSLKALDLLRDLEREMLYINSLPGQCVDRTVSCSRLLSTKDIDWCVRNALKTVHMGNVPYYCQPVYTSFFSSAASDAVLVHYNLTFPWTKSRITLSLPTAA